jgi:uncharacterized protein (DUF1786 family)
MKNYLLIDIGAGTMDVMCYVPDENMHYKAVVQSPVRTLGAAIAATEGNLVVTGVEMGGGQVTDALKDRTRQAEVVMTASAAATVHHDLERVKAMGIRIVADRDAERLQNDPTCTPVRLQDIDSRRIRQIVEGFGLPFEFASIAVCAQDHGVAPAGVSHLDFRHQLFKSRLDAQPYPHTLLYSADTLPETFHRLHCIAQSASDLPTEQVYVMDSGMAAIAGASMDASLKQKETYMVLDIATSHTVGAVVGRGELLASFEYHTHDITLERLERLMRDLADGNLDHNGILAEGGHGAYLRHAPGFDRIEAIVATGPKRRLLAESTMAISWGAPWGDNMMTGCVGLLRAVKHREEKGPLGIF